MILGVLFSELKSNLNPNYDKIYLYDYEAKGVKTKWLAHL